MMNDDYHTAPNTSSILANWHSVQVGTNNNNTRSSSSCSTIPNIITSGDGVSDNNNDDDDDVPNVNERPMNTKSTTDAAAVMEYNDSNNNNNNNTLLVSTPNITWNTQNVQIIRNFIFNSSSSINNSNNNNKKNSHRNNDIQLLQQPKLPDYDDNNINNINTTAAILQQQQQDNNNNTTNDTNYKNINNNNNNNNSSSSSRNSIIQHQSSYWEGFDGPKRYIRNYTCSIMNHYNNNNHRNMNKNNNIDTGCCCSSSSSSSSSSSNTVQKNTNDNDNKNSTDNVNDSLTSTTTTSIEDILNHVQERIYQRTGLQTTYIKIEEYVPLLYNYHTSSSSSSSSSSNNNNNNNKTSTSTNTNRKKSCHDTKNCNNNKHWMYDPYIISTFPYNNHNHNESEINDNDDSTDAQQQQQSSSSPYFIAEIPIIIVPSGSDTSSLSNIQTRNNQKLHLIQNWNQPWMDHNEQQQDQEQKQNPSYVPIAMRWRLQSEDHSTYITPSIPPISSELSVSSTDNDGVTTSGNGSNANHNNNNPCCIIRTDDMCTKWRNSRYMYVIDTDDSPNVVEGERRGLNNDTTDVKFSKKKQVAPMVLPAIRVLQFYNFDPKGTTKQEQYKNDRNGNGDEANVDVSSTNNKRSVLDNFGYVPTNPDEITERTRRLQIRDDGTDLDITKLVTILITTSPIKSHPSTNVIERAMNTFHIANPTFATQCSKVIVCDGYRTITDNNDNDDDNNNDNKDNDTEHNVDSLSNADTSVDDTKPVSNDATKNKPNIKNIVSRRHCNDKQSMRNGIVTEQQANNYCQYKRNLHTLCNNADETSVFNNTQIIELETRHGYGYAVRHVLRNTNAIQTPYICVVQHDRTFMRPTPIVETLHAMWMHGNIKYIGFSMRSNLMYRDIYTAKYGKSSIYDDMILYVPELQVSSKLYGPNSTSTNSLTVQNDNHSNNNNERVKQNIHTLVETYKGSAQAFIERKIVVSPENNCKTSEDLTINNNLMSSNNNSNPSHITATQQQHLEPLRDHQISLVPTLYWYDNVHICETKHYRDFIFHPSYKMVAKGGFIEDKLSPIIKKTVERLGLREGHSRFGCYLLDDHSGMFFTGHIDGGSYISPEERERLLAAQKQQQTNIVKE